jgi:DNA-binding CsgD family transcriptional regulator
VAIGRPIRNSAEAAIAIATARRLDSSVTSRRTTREVADALFLTPRAVEANLGKVYQKLGIRCRVELDALLGPRATRPL